MRIGECYDDGFDEECGKTIAAERCMECSGRLRTEGGEISCRECGLIIDDQLLDGREARFRAVEDGGSGPRTGPPLTALRHDRGLSGEVGYPTRDARGQPLSGRARNRMHRLRTQHARARFATTAEQNLAYACSEIRRIASGLELPTSLQEVAATLYRRAQAADLIRGRSIERVVGGALYAACRCASYHRSVEEIAHESGYSTHDVEAGYRLLNVEFGLAAEIVTPRTVVAAVASECGVSAATEARAYEYTTVAADAGISNGRHPGGVAAGCLYAAGLDEGVTLSQQHIATQAGVSTPTLRARYNDLRAVLES